MLMVPDPNGTEPIPGKEGNMQTTFYMLVGMPGSGKSCWADQMALQGISVHSSDAIRAELLHDENCQDNPRMIFREMEKRAMADLKQGHSCIYDATNVSRKRRISFLRNVPGNIRKVCVLFLVQPEVCRKRDAERSRTVGTDVIDKFLRSFHCPYWYEGWDEIIPVIDDASFSFPIESMVSFPQDNPHHRLTLGKHMQTAYQYCIANDHPYEVQIAAAYHDCGKFFTKKFENSKGVPTESAHYYGHENYGTYLFLLDAYQGNERWKYGGFEKTLYIAQLINWHMRPFEAWGVLEEPKDADRKLLGEQMISDIINLHAADAQAH